MAEKCCVKSPLEGFVPAIIIEEDSAIGDEEREKFLKRIEGNPVAPTIIEQIVGLDVDHVTVPIHNSEEVMPHIHEMDLDLIVFEAPELFVARFSTSPMMAWSIPILVYSPTVEDLQVLLGRYTTTSPLAVPLTLRQWNRYR